MEDGLPIPETWSFEISSNKRPIKPTDDPITELFDGGENVYVKVSIETLLYDVIFLPL